MNDNVDEQEQLLAWFDGGMVNSFPQTHTSHEEAESAARELSLAREVLRAEGRRAVVAKVHSSYIGKTAIRPGRVVSIKPRKIIQWLSAAAAVLIIFLVVRTSADRDSAETLYAEAFTSYHVVNVRAAGDSLSKIATAFSAKDYRLATGLAEQRSDLVPEEVLVTGLSHLENKNFTAAAARFESLRVEKGSGELIRDAADYYLALTMILQKRFSEGAQLMKQIRANTQHTYRDKFPEDFIQRVAQLEK